MVTITWLLRHPCDIHGEPGPAPWTGLNFPHDSSISLTWHTPENGCTEIISSDDKHCYALIGKERQLSR